MENYMKSIREQLLTLDQVLDHDQREFDDKLNFTRSTVFKYIDRHINQLMQIKAKYGEEFNYLDDENRNTCQTNRRAFDKLCTTINKNDDDEEKVIELLNQFKSSFPIRPRMLQDIPEFDFQPIDFEHLIQKKQEISVERSFLPIENHAEISTDGSIGHSHHKQFAEQNNGTDFEPQSRLVSTCSTITSPDTMVDLLYKIPYAPHRTPHLITIDDQDEFLLMYSFQSRQLEHLSRRTRQQTTIDLLVKEPILNLGFSKTNRLFYLSTRQTNRMILFRLNDKQMEIVEEIDLLNEGEYFINVHIYENFILFLYVTSGIIMLGKYDLERSSRCPPFSFRNQLYDSDENSTFRMIDFAVHDSLIAFLVQLKRYNKWMIRIYDCDSMHKLHSFDLIDADKPLSIVTSENGSQSSTSTDQVDSPLLFVNDPKGHLIHCCTYEEYVMPIQVNAFGICALKDGNLSLVGSRDIRGLKVQDYLQRNRE